MKKIIDNYSAFYSMLLLTTVLSNYQDERFKEDAKKIIQFVKEAYELDDETAAECEKQILDDLTAISTDNDVRAYLSFNDFQEGEELNPLYQAKCDAITAVEKLRAIKSFDTNEEWFNYQNYKRYYPELRFHQLSTAAMSGNVLANRTVGVMLALGIGCEKDEEAADTRLSQCLFWGDIESIYYLKKIYKDADNKDAVKFFDDLIKLSALFKQGITVVPDSEVDKYDPAAVGFFTVISSIKQDIILKEKLFDIDYSFVEAIQSNIDYYEKMRYINRYSYYEWKEVTNSSLRPEKPSAFGFRMEGKKK